MNLEDKKFIFLVRTHRAYKEFKNRKLYCQKVRLEKSYIRLLKMLNFHQI